MYGYITVKAFIVTHETRAGPDRSGNDNGALSLHPFGCRDRSIGCRNPTRRPSKNSSPCAAARVSPPPDCVASATTGGGQAHPKRGGFVMMARRPESARYHQRSISIGRFFRGVKCPEHRMRAREIPSWHGNQCSMHADVGGRTSTGRVPCIVALPAPVGIPKTKMIGRCRN
jgi:hypothetical protein